MPFEGFLGDLRTRPLRLRLLGYLASMGLHLPPLTAFAVAWLTQELVLEHALDLPDVQSAPRLVYYEVPAHFVAGLPDGVALASAASKSGEAEAANGARGARHGKAGAGKRRSRRPLEFNPRHRKAHGPVPAQLAAIGPEEFGHDEGNGQGSSHRNARGDDGDGAGGHSYGAGSGDGHGNSDHGSGGGTHGLKAPGPGVTAMGLWIPPEPIKKEVRSKKDGEGRNGEDDELPDGLEDGEDDVAVVGAPLAGRPQRVSMNYAAYLRTFDPLPTLPDSCWPPGRQSNTVLLEICVSERGDVKDVVIRQSAGNDVDSYLSDSVKTWRYRPRIIQGTPRPFCHPIRLVYTKAPRWDRPW